MANPTEVEALPHLFGLRSPNGEPSFSRDAVIHVFENAVHVTERHDAASAFYEL